MTKTLRLLSLATVLATGVATATMAANDGASGSQQVTGTMTDGQYTTGTPPTNVDPRKGSSGTGMSAQSTGPQYPAVVGPTGSHQQDATNPNRSSPTLLPECDHRILTTRASGRDPRGAGGDEEQQQDRRAEGHWIRRSNPEQQSVREP